MGPTSGGSRESIHVHESNSGSEQKEGIRVKGRESQLSVVVIGQRRESEEGNTGYVTQRRNVDGLKVTKRTELQNHPL